MKKFLKNMEYNWDYYFVYFLFNGMKTDRYYDYMSNKWGDKWYTHMEKNHQDYLNRWSDQDQDSDVVWQK